MKKSRAQDSEGFGLLAIIVALAVVAFIVIGGWYVWQARMKNSQTTTATTHSPTTNNQASSSNNQTSSPNVFKIPELGVEFSITGGIMPLYLYSAGNLTWNGINYQNVPLSTQQLVDKGATEANGGKNLCSFSGSSSTFLLNDIQVFNSSSDALTFLKATSNTNLTTNDMTTANGFFMIGNKVFYVQQGILDGPCLHDSNFETQQWQSLHNSLMTLSATQ